MWTNEDTICKLTFPFISTALGAPPTNSERKRTNVEKKEEWYILEAQNPRGDTRV